MLVTAGHLALFAWVGLRTPLTFMRPMDPPPPVEAFLMPPPPPPQPRETAADSPPNRAAPYRPRLILPAAPGEVAPIPAPPAAAGSDQGPRSAPAPLPAPWDGLRQALRGSVIGCAERDRVGLTAAERAACDEKLGLASRDAPSLGLALEPGKQARFDAAAAEKRAWTAYQECQTGPACEAAYPGHWAAARRLLGKR